MSVDRVFIVDDEQLRRQQEALLAFHRQNDRLFHAVASAMPGSVLDGRDRRGARAVPLPASAAPGRLTLGASLDQPWYAPAEAPTLDLPRDGETEES